MPALPRPFRPGPKFHRNLRSLAGIFPNARLGRLVGGDALAKASRSFSGKTSISGAIDYGLVIVKEPATPLMLEHAQPHAIVDYYRDRVIGGPGAFVMLAEDIESFGRA